jgi:hypothetical protein
MCSQEVKLISLNTFLLWEILSCSFQTQNWRLSTFVGAQSEKLPKPFKPPKLKMIGEGTHAF